MPITSLQFRRLEPLLNDEQWLKVARRLAISNRELQIVRLIFEDESENTIASLLEISQHTVHTHLKHLHLKLCVNSRVGLVLRIFRECFADAEQDNLALPKIMLPRSTRKAA